MMRELGQTEKAGGRAGPNVQRDISTERGIYAELPVWVFSKRRAMISGDVPLALRLGALRLRRGSLLRRFSTRSE